MKRGNKGILKFIVLFILLSILSNCSTISEINLLYSLPNPNHRLRGVKIYILFKDKRERKDILSDEAKKVLKNFSGTLTFHLKRYGDTAFRIGPFSLKEILMSSFSSSIREGIISSSVASLYLNAAPVSMISKEVTPRCMYGFIFSETFFRIQFTRARVLCLVFFSSSEQYLLYISTNSLSDVFTRICSPLSSSSRNM